MGYCLTEWPQMDPTHLGAQGTLESEALYNKGPLGGPFTPLMGTRGAPMQLKGLKWVPTPLSRVQESSL